MQTSHKWQIQYAKLAPLCETFHPKYSAHWHAFQMQPGKRNSISTRPTCTSRNTTFMCIMCCWPCAQPSCSCLCALFADYFVAFAANDRMAMATIAAIREPAHDFWSCKLITHTHTHIIVHLAIMNEQQFPCEQIGEIEINFHFILFYLQGRYRHIFDNIHSISGWNCCVPGRISYASWRLFAIKVS